MELVVGKSLLINFINATGVISTVDVTFSGRSCTIGPEVCYELVRTTPLSADYKAKYPDVKESYMLSGTYIKSHQPEWHQELTSGETVTI